jgi:hypothetical protein
MRLPFKYTFHPIIILICFQNINVLLSLENGLGRTPPMGWLSW